MSSNDHENYNLSKTQIDVGIDGYYVNENMKLNFYQKEIEIRNQSTIFKVTDICFDFEAILACFCF